MPRIRTIKPEFHAHEELSNLPPETHLLAAALVNYADDEGYFNANPVLLKAGTNPLRQDATPIQIQLHQLVKIGYIEIVAHGDKCFGRILTFTTHQKVAHPAKSKIKDKFEALPKDSGMTRELFTPEGNREQGREQGREGIAVPPPEAFPSTVFPSSAEAVEAIVCAHPRSQQRNLLPGQCRQRDCVAVIEAIGVEARAHGITDREAAAMLLEMMNTFADKVPRSQWRYLKDVAEFFACFDYRRDPAEFAAFGGPKPPEPSKRKYWKIGDPLA